MSGYRIKVINTKSGEARLVPQKFSSKKKAEAFAENWKKAVPNSDCQVVDA